MEPVLRAVIVYTVLLIIFRLAGRRTLSEMTTFDFVLLLIIAEVTEPAMLGSNATMTSAFLVILTLILLDIGLSLWKQKSPVVSRWLEGLPMVIVENGRPLKDLMNRARVDESDVMQAARELQGLKHMDQIQFAVLEASGHITIIPKPDARN